MWKVKALLDAFNQEKALVGAFSVIVKTDGSFAALIDMDWYAGPGGTAAKRQLYFVMDGGGGGPLGRPAFLCLRGPAASRQPANGKKMKTVKSF